MPKPHFFFGLIIFYAASLAVPVMGTCPPGSGKPSPPNPLVTCELCGAGKYKIATGDALCTNCPANTMSPEGSSQEHDCVCNAGSYFSATTISCSGECPCPSVAPVSVVSSGEILSQTGPKYTNNLNCKWIISSDDAISVQFTRFSVENGYDDVRIETCTSSLCDTTTTLQRYHGGDYSLSRVFTSTTGHLLIHFRSDGAFTKEGFALQWSVADDSNVCELCVAGKYKIDPGNAECTDCMSGQYSAEVGAIACQDCPANKASPEGSTQVLDCVCKAGFLPQTDGSCVMIECPAGKTYAYANVVCIGCSCNEKQANDLNYPNNDKRWPGSISCGWKVSGNVAIILEKWGTHLQEYNSDWMWTCDKFSDPTMLCASPKGVNSIWVPSRTRGYSMNWRKSSTCIDCPVATYRSQDDVNTNVMCKPCANNSGTDSTASTNVDDCKCNAGWSMLSQNNAVCSKCPSGKFKSERSHDACTRCPTGKFMSGNLSNIPRTVKYTYTKVV